MLSYAFALLVLLASAPQQVPRADTTRPAADTAQAMRDTQAVVLPLGDTTRISPLPGLAQRPAQTTSQPVISAPQQAATDTLPVVSPDSLTAASPDALPAARPAAVPDTSAAGALDEGVVRRELESLQRGISRQFAQLREAFTLTRLLLAVLALAFTYLVVSLTTWLMERIARWRPGYAYGIRRVVPLVKFGLWFVAVWLVVGSLFAGSTVVLVLLVLVVAVAVGVTSFQFLRDLAGGLILTFEQPFQIGSRVAVGEHKGVVRQVGLRSFELETSDGSTVVIPNAEVLRRSVTATQPDALEASVTVKLSVPEAVDLDVARALVREAAYASPYIFAARPVTVSLAPPDGRNERMQLCVEAYVFNAQYVQALASDVVRLAHGAFAQAGGKETPAADP